MPVDRRLAVVLVAAGVTACPSPKGDVRPPPPPPQPVPTVGATTFVSAQPERGDPLHSRGGNTYQCRYGAYVRFAALRGDTFVDYDDGRLRFLDAATSTTSPAPVALSGRPIWRRGIDDRFLVLVMNDAVGSVDAAGVRPSGAQVVVYDLSDPFHPSKRTSEIVDACIDDVRFSIVDGELRLALVSTFPETVHRIDVDREGRISPSSAFDLEDGAYWIDHETMLLRLYSVEHGRTIRIVTLGPDRTLTLGPHLPDFDLEFTSIARPYPGLLTFHTEEAIETFRLGADLGLVPVDRRDAELPSSEHVDGWTIRRGRGDFVRFVRIEPSGTIHTPGRVPGKYIEAGAGQLLVDESDHLRLYALEDGEARLLDDSMMDELVSVSGTTKRADGSWLVFATDGTEVLFFTVADGRITPRGSLPWTVDTEVLGQTKAGRLVTATGGRLDGWDFSDPSNPRAVWSIEGPPQRWLFQAESFQGYVLELYGHRDGRNLRVLARDALGTDRPALADVALEDADRLAVAANHVVTYSHEGPIEVWDFARPTMPRREARIPYDREAPGLRAVVAHPTAPVAAVVRAEFVEVDDGTLTRRVWTPLYGRASCEGRGPDCTFIAGEAWCEKRVWPDGRIEESCVSRLQACTNAGICRVADAESVPVEEGAVTTETVKRNAQRGTIQLLALDADVDVRRQVITTDVSEGDFEEVRAFGDSLWVVTTAPAGFEGDTRRYRRWFVQRIDLAGTEHEPRINVPGRPVAWVDGALLTRDVLFGPEREGDVDTLNRLRLLPDVAELEEIRALDERLIDVVAAEDGLVLLVQQGDDEARARLEWVGARLDAIAATESQSDASLSPAHDDLVLLSVRSSAMAFEKRGAEIASIAFVPRGDTGPAHRVFDWLLDNVFATQLRP